jgi:hypothetical protein
VSSEFYDYSWPSFLITQPERLGSAPLPKSTQELLKKFKIDRCVLADIDQELQVPQEWFEKAKKEGKLGCRSTPAEPSEVKMLLAPFRERYPFIEVEFSGSNQKDRSVKTLVVYKSGWILGDLLSSVAGFIEEYKKIGALEGLAIDSPREEPSMG